MMIPRRRAKGSTRSRQARSFCPMRAPLLALAGLFLMTGLAAAVEVTLLDFDKEQKRVTVKEGEEQKTYKLTDATKFFGIDSEGVAREMTYDDAVKGLGNEKAKGVLKFDVEVKGEDIAAARFKAKKRK